MLACYMFIVLRVGIEREFTSRVDQRVLTWFGLVERMDEFVEGGRNWNACSVQTKVRMYSAPQRVADGT